MSYPALLKQVIRTVESAGERLIKEWQRPDGPRGSGDKAEVDLEIESQLRPELLSLLSCDFWGEETGSELTGADHCWVIDPNDGTADFLRGYKGSALSIGLLRNSEPVLGVVYAPVLEDQPADCIAWAEGMPHVLRNGMPVMMTLANRTLTEDTKVMVSIAAQSKPELNSQLCAPAAFVPMPSIAYRLARVAAGDGVAGVSLYPVSAHDVVAGHALLIGAGGVLLDQDGQPVSYATESRMNTVSLRCFGGATSACLELASRDWNKVLNASS